MKKVNNKGLTLVELIVSFAIVGVAIIYFYQTISTVSKLYTKSRDDTNDFADETYVLRLVDAKLDKIMETYSSPSGKNINLLDNNAKNELENFCLKKLDNAECTVSGPETNKNSNNYHFYVINIKTKEKKNYKLYRRATIKTIVGTKTETYKKIADSVNLSQASDSSKNYGITYSESGANKINETFSVNNGIDCKAQKCDSQVKEKNKNIKYVRDDFRLDVEDESKQFSKISGKWRTYRPCISNIENSSNEEQYIIDNFMKTQEDYKRGFYGTFTVKNCSNNIDVTGIKKNMIITSVVTGDWKNQGDFTCQGILNKVLDLSCNDNTKDQNNPLKPNLNRKLNTDWLTLTSENHRYSADNNGTYSGSSYLWVIQNDAKPIGINWNLSALSNNISIKRYRVVANTYVQWDNIYDVYAFED